MDGMENVPAIIDDMSRTISFGQSLRQQRMNVWIALCTFGGYREWISVLHVQTFHTEYLYPCGWEDTNLPFHIFRYPAVDMDRSSTLLFASYIFTMFPLCPENMQSFHSTILITPCANAFPRARYIVFRWSPSMEHSITSPLLNPTSMESRNIIIADAPATSNSSFTSSSIWGVSGESPFSNFHIRIIFWSIERRCSPHTPQHLFGPLNGITSPVSGVARSNAITPPYVFAITLFFHTPTVFRIARKGTIQAVDIHQPIAPTRSRDQ